MKKRNTRWVVFICLLVFLLGGCSLLNRDKNLEGIWRVQFSFLSSQYLQGILVIDSNSKIFFTGMSLNEIEVLDYKILRPDKIMFDFGNNQVPAKYQVSGDILTIEFEDGINYYQRLKKEDLAGIDDLPSIIEEELSNDTWGEIVDPNSFILTTSISDESAAQAPVKPQEATSTPLSPTRTPAPVVSPTPRAYYPLSGCGESQVHLGDSVYVNYATGKVGMREEPSARMGDLLIRRLDEGEVLHVIDGPICDMGWVFWKVRTVYSEKGWIPEGDENEFWVLPLNTEKVCSGAKPTRLWVGASAYVEPEPVDYNRVYPEPKINSDKLIHRMKPGSFMQVLRGPECGPNREGVWWYVRAESGDEGWTRESDYAKDYYFIAPVIPRP